MLYFRRFVLPRVRLLLLAVSVLLVLGLNQRTVRVLRAPAGTTRLAPRTLVVKQKVMLEATASRVAFVAPALAAWLPTGATTSVWPPVVRRALALALPRAGLRLGEAFCARLLAVALSPQAP